MLLLVTALALLLQVSGASSNNLRKIDIVFEDIYLTDKASTLVSKVTKCNDNSSVNMGLITSSGTHGILSCNKCTSGIYLFSKSGKTAYFYSFSAEIGNSKSECLRKMEEIKLNLSWINTARVLIKRTDSFINLEENSEVKSVLRGEIKRIFSIGQTSLNKFMENSKWFCSKSFETLVLLLNLYKKNTGNGKEIARIQNDDFLRTSIITLGLYRHNLEKQLLKCSTTRPCSELLIKEAFKFKEWFSKNQNFIKNLVHTLDLKTFNNYEFYALLTEINNYSPIAKLESIHYQSEKARNLIQGMQNSIEQIKANEQNNAKRKEANSDPERRSAYAIGVLESCRQHRSKTLLNSESSTATIIANLHSWLDRQQSTSGSSLGVRSDLVHDYFSRNLGENDKKDRFSSIYNFYSQSGLINPEEHTKRLKGTCVELIDTAIVKVDSSKNKVNKIKQNSQLVASTLNTRINVLNSYCSVVKDTVDDIKKSIHGYYDSKMSNYFELFNNRSYPENSIGSDRIQRHQNHFDQLALSKIHSFNKSMEKDDFATEIELYLNGLGKYADTSKYPSAELVKMAFIALFSDIYSDKGITVPSPMGILSADSGFRKKISFDRLSNNFLLNCINDGYLIPHQTTNSISDISFGTIPLGKVDLEITTNDVFVSTNNILEKIDKALVKMNREKKYCLMGPDTIPGSGNRQYIGPSNSTELSSKERIRRENLHINLEARNEKIRYENTKYNNKRKDIIGRYVTSSPSIIVNYILRGSDDYVNFSVLCDSIISYYNNIEEVNNIHNANDWATSAFLLTSLFGGPILIVSVTGAIIVSVRDTSLSISRLFDIRKERMLTDIDVILGGNAISSDFLRSQKKAMIKEEWINMGWNALVATIMLKAASRVAKPLYKTRNTKIASSSAPPTIEKFSKKCFGRRIASAMEINSVNPSAILQTSRNLADSVIKWLKTKNLLVKNASVPLLRNFLTRIFVSRTKMSLNFREMAECIKYSSKLKGLVIKNLVSVKEISDPIKGQRLLYGFKSGDKILEVAQTIKPNHLTQLKSKFGHDVSKWLIRYNANRMEFGKWRKVIKNDPRYSRMNEQQLYKEYQALQYSNRELQIKLDNNPWRNKKIKSLNTNQQIPTPPRLYQEQSKYVDNAMLAFLSDFFIRNAATYQGYTSNLGDKDFSWWAIAPDHIGTSFKAFVPYIGIKKMDKVNNSISFGYPNQTRFFKEQWQSGKASYLPSIDFNNTVEVSSNMMYKGSDEAVHSYGLEYENQVALARYLSATLWTVSAGMFMKTFVWSIMQGVTCMIPNWKGVVNLKLSAGQIKALQFSAAAGLSYSYSRVTSDWFFKMRNFTLHKMDLYTQEELNINGLPMDAITQEENKTSDELNTLQVATNIKSDIPLSYDQEVPLEISWEDTLGIEVDFEY